MTKVFRKVSRSDYEPVFIYRYLESMLWAEISKMMMASPSTVKLWHREALSRLTLPET